MPNQKQHICLNQKIKETLKLLLINIIDITISFINSLLSELINKQNKKLILLIILDLILIFINVLINNILKIRTIFNKLKFIFVVLSCIIIIILANDDLILMRISLTTYIIIKIINVKAEQALKIKKERGR